MKFRLLPALFTLAAILGVAFAGFSAWSAATGPGAPRNAQEIPGQAHVEEITYGSERATATSERGEGDELCFLTLDSGAEFDLPLSHCSVNEGDLIGTLGSAEGERLSPDFFASELFTARRGMIFGGTVALGGVAGLVVLGIRRATAGETFGGEELPEELEAQGDIPS